MANTLNETMTYQEVADLLGVSPSTVRHMVRKGTLTGTPNPKNPYGLTIAGDDVETYIDGLVTAAGIS